MIKAVIPSSLKHHFKILCTQKEQTMSQILERLIAHWIETDAPLSNLNIDLSEGRFENVKGYIPKSLKLQFKIICAQKKVQMSRVLYNLIKDWIKTDKIVH